MSIEPGTYALGPENATLTLRTGRRGAIAKAGHDLRIEVEAWRATVTLDGDPSQAVLELTADSHSLRVREGSGGMKSLDADDRAGIEQTINQEVLKGTAIVFRSREVSWADNRGLFVTGDLELSGASRPISFDLQVGDDGQVSGSAVVKQTDWGMKPYTALFGTLKVSDEVHVSIAGRLASI
ncbi:MAG: YceI family protein [Solirubrobacteraceae bacterium]